MLRTPRRARHRLGAAVVGVIALVALSASTPASASLSTRPTSTAAILRAGVIAPTDVPSGWTPNPHPPKSDQSLRGIPTCKAVIAIDTVANRTTTQARSATFTDPANGKATSAENTVFVYNNAAGARKLLGVYATMDAAECLRASVGRQIGPQATTTVSPITDLGTGADGRIGYEIVVSGTATNGQPVSLYADILFVRVGRTVTGFAFTNPSVRLPQAPGIVTAVVRRLV